jgi:hypothetical protein
LNDFVRKARRCPTGVAAHRPSVYRLVVRVLLDTHSTVGTPRLLWPHVAWWSIFYAESRINSVALNYPKDLLQLKNCK